MKKSLLLTIFAGSLFLNFVYSSENLQEIQQNQIKTQVDEKENKNIIFSKNSDHTSMLVGVGFGGNAIDIDDKAKGVGFKSYGAFDLTAQVGGITMFNQHFGIEYFYNLSLMFDTSLYNTDVVNNYLVYGGIWNPPQTITINNHYNIFGLLATSTINANAILNFYTSEKLKVGIVSGLGLGFDIAHYSGTATLPITTIGGQNIFREHSINNTNVFFDIRANIGLRFAFLQDYVLSLNCSIAFLDNTIISDIKTKDTASFDVRFAYLLF